MAEARHGGNVAVSLSGLVQTKVALGSVGDRYEREADAVSDRVSAGQAAPEISRIPPGGLGVQRQMDEEVTGTDTPVQEQAENTSEEKDAQKGGAPGGKSEPGPIQAKAQEEENAQTGCADCGRQASVQSRHDDKPSDPSPEPVQTQSLKETEPSDSAPGEDGDVQAQADESSSDDQAFARSSDDDPTDRSEAGTQSGEQGPEGAGGNDSEAQAQEQADNREADDQAAGHDEEAQDESEADDDRQADAQADAGTCGGGAEGGEQEQEGGDAAGGGGCGGAAQNVAEEPAGDSGDTTEASSAEAAGEASAQEAPGQDDGSGACNTDVQRVAEDPEDAQVQPQTESAGEDSDQDAQVQPSPDNPRDPVQEIADRRDAASRGSGAHRRPQRQRAAIAGQAIRNRCPGEPLAADIRSRLERALGYDLSHVRLHTGTRARETTRRLNAKAFTHKNHIWLGPGQSPSDMKLLAHEMTHVIQQGSARNRSGPDADNIRQGNGKAPGAARGDGTQRPAPDRIGSENAPAAQSLTAHAKTESATDDSERENAQRQEVPSGTVTGGTAPGSRTVSMPTARLGKFQWSPGDMELADSAIELYIGDIDPDEKKKKEILRLIEAAVMVMWRRFKVHVDDSGGLKALSTEERAYVEAEKGHVKAAERGLSPDAEIPHKDRKGHALRRKALNAMRHLLNDKYFIYWMFSAGTLLLWDEVSDETRTVDEDKFSESVNSISSGPTFVQSVIRTFIYSAMAKWSNIEVEDVWYLLQPEDEMDKEQQEGKGKDEKEKPLAGEFTQKRRQSLTRKQKELLKRLPGSIRKSKDQDGLINLLDRLLAMPKAEQDAFIDHLKAKATAEKGKKKTSTEQEDRQESDTIDPQKIADEIKAARMAAKMGQGEEARPDPERQKQMAAVLAGLSDEERRAFLKFLEENKGKQTDGKPIDPKLLYEKYAKLTEADKEALRLKRMLGEQQTGPAARLTDQDQKNARILINKTKAEAKAYKAGAKKINDSIASLLCELDDGQAKSDLKPIDPDDFDVMPEMIMLLGMIEGAGKMSPEIKTVGDQLKTQIGALRGKLLEEIAWIGAELAAHVALGAIPVVGWLKTAFTVGRLIKLAKRLNDIRKKLRALQRGYDVYQRVRGAVSTAQAIIVHARGFVEKFEEARQNYEYLRSQLESLDSPDELDERIEAIQDQLMEQMHDKLELLEPLMDKMYLPDKVRDDPEKLIQILFNLPQGMKAFSTMVDTYDDMADRTDPDQLRLLYYKGMQAGVLLYPLVGFVIGALSEALTAWFEKPRDLMAFLDKQKAWSKRGRHGSKTGSRLRALWPRRMVYKGHTKTAKPQFKAPLAEAMARLEKMIPTPAPWQFRLRPYLRYYLRGFVKKLNRERMSNPKFKVLGRKKGSKEAYRPVPVPKFKYKLRTKQGKHEVTLRINPKVIKQFDATIFETEGVPRPDRRTKEGKAFAQWLEKNHYEIRNLAGVGWNIRLKGGRYETKKRPYLRFANDRLIKKGLASEQVGELNRFERARKKIFGSEQLPEGFHLRTDKLPSRRPGIKAKERYVVTPKKYAKRKVADNLYLHDDGTLRIGPSPRSKKGPEIKLADPPGSIKKATAFDTRNRPKEAVGKVGYTVNKDRGSMDKIPDMRKKDDKGHIIAARFNGVDRKENLVPMNRQLNQKGAWYKEEAALATSYKRVLKKAVLDNKDAEAQVWIHLGYNNSNPRRRPNTLDFRWEVKQKGKSNPDESGKMPTASNP